jgi:hypothetical protein
MKARIQIAVAVVFLLIGSAYSQTRDATSRDVRGIPQSRKYFWSVFGGTVLGTGIGIIAPGGNKSAVKGAILGGSITSAFYLATHRKAASGFRPWAHVITNAAIVGGGLWTICDCGSWGWAGALIGGGGTAVLQSFGRGNRRLTASNAGPADQSGTIALASATPVFLPTWPSSALLPPDLAPMPPGPYLEEIQRASVKTDVAPKGPVQSEKKPEQEREQQE